MIGLENGREMFVQKKVLILGLTSLALGIALVSLVGEKTSVRMWAERPATAAQLRAGASQLSQALSRAELNPGDIVIRDGAPPQAAPAKAGHFLDRAL